VGSFIKVEVYKKPVLFLMMSRVFSRRINSLCF
jgi:hypothetical protein